ncbi:hypothetical protein GCM10010168_58070 [Actinoplanes ianthinogenes]|uniref:DUF7144 domain-containing protein n=1 Tax=Actinoplanes ianthinogenes TaxID=122358 RepID=A0ABM7M298_9ACTN|nr:hypothetical protein [Actinoplanes ianthinogenes]BCJ45773.1 hypothetical protein Aiant_64300 [Actinoplanes ianthinogenes]GGR32057.1 hypothetical protein GCM10010168_58070 [Actinoplanes ianthinogenes]
MEIEESRASGWVAWVLFGGILLVLLGAVHLTVGLIALLRPEVLADTRSEHLFSMPLTGLAWVHLALGVVALVTGVGLIRGVAWARIVAIVIALLTALVNFAFIAVYPAWSVIAIVLATLIAWAVAAHGGEVADAYGR